MVTETTAALSLDTTEDALAFLSANAGSQSTGFTKYNEIFLDNRETVKVLDKDGQPVMNDKGLPKKEENSDFGKLFAIQYGQDNEILEKKELKKGDQFTFVVVRQKAKCSDWENFYSKECDRFTDVIVYSTQSKNPIAKDSYKNLKEQYGLSYLLVAYVLIDGVAYRWEAKPGRLKFYYGTGKANTDKSVESSMFEVINMHEDFLNPNTGKGRELKQFKINKIKAESSSSGDIVWNDVYVTVGDDGDVMATANAFQELAKIFSKSNEYKKADAALLEAPATVESTEAEEVDIADVDKVMPWEKN